MKNMVNITNQKKVIRKKLNAARQRISPEQKIKANKEIAEKLILRPEWKNAQMVCIYMSLPEEVDTGSLLESLFELKKSIVIPKVSTDGNLSLYLVRSMSDLAVGAYKILEPTIVCPRVSPGLVDFFIVPGVAFDRQGHRLGWGKGYYDRLLQHVHSPRIALAYAIQVIAEVPHSSYDVSVSTIITEKEVIDIHS